MIPWVIVKLHHLRNDGITLDTIDFLDPTGVWLIEWQPDVAQAKEGGYWIDSKTSPGRMLAGEVEENSLETMKLGIVDNIQRYLNAKYNALGDILSVGSAYWYDRTIYYPAYWEARRQGETTSRYGIVRGGSIKNFPLGAGYTNGAIVNGVSYASAFDTVELSTEVEGWYQSPPHLSEANPVSVTNQRNLGIRDVMIPVKTAVASRTRGFCRHTGSGALYASANNLILKSADGFTWNDNYNGGGYTNGMLALANNYLLAFGATVSRSTDDGGSWGTITPAGASPGISDIIQLANGNVIATDGRAQVWRSVNNGDSWTLVFTFPAQTGWSFGRLHQAPNGDVLLFHYGRVARSTDNGQTWLYNSSVYEAVSPHFYPSSALTLGDGSILLLLNYQFTDGSKILRSADNGQTWTILGTNVYTRLEKFLLVGSEIYATFGLTDDGSTGMAGVMVSSDGGSHWRKAMIGPRLSPTTDPARPLGIYRNTANGYVFLGGGPDDGTGSIYLWASGATSAVGPAASTGRQSAMISGSFRTSPLTHIFIDDGGVYTDITFAALPCALFPASPAVNDALYFIFDSASLPGWYARHLVFNIGTPLQGAMTVVWEAYIATLGGWYQLDSVGIIDTISGFAKPGVGVVSNNSAYTLTQVAVNGVTGYAIRARVTSVSGTITIPTQASWQIFSPLAPYFDISNTQIGGKYAMLHLKLYWEHLGASSDTGLRGVLIGSRSLNRGSDFQAFLNLSRYGLDSVMKVGISGDYTSFIADGGDNCRSTATGEAVFFNPAGLSPLATIVKLSIDESVAYQYEGRFRCYLRMFRGEGSIGDIGVRVGFQSTYGDPIFYTDMAYPPAPLNSYNTGLSYLLDLGEVVLPRGSQRSQVDQSDLLKIYIQVSNTVVSARRVVLHDLILMPVDEQVINVTAPTMTGTDMINFETYLDLDGICNPRDRVVAALRKVGGNKKRANYIVSKTGDFTVRSEEAVRLWFLTYGTHSFATDTYHSSLNAMISAEVFKNERYKTS